LISIAFTNQKIKIHDENSSSTSFTQVTNSFSHATATKVISTTPEFKKKNLGSNSRPTRKPTAYE